jgi:hypothetical protein
LALLRISASNNVLPNYQGLQTLAFLRCDRLKAVSRCLTFLDLHFGQLNFSLVSGYLHEEAEHFALIQTNSYVGILHLLSDINREIPPKNGSWTGKLANAVYRRRRAGRRIAIAAGGPLGHRERSFQRMTEFS